MSCTSCKKPKKLKVLEPLKVEEIMGLPPVYSLDEIKLAYYELTSMGGVKEDKKEMIQNVYQSLFNEPFDFNCSSCVSRQSRKFHNYLKEQLKLKL